jgi:hypothetical protein
MPVTKALSCAALAALALGFGLASTVAGEINDLDGPAIKGHDPVAYFTERKPVAGTERLTARYKDATFRFASIANRDAFLADPARYAPQYGGFCAYGAAGGYKADTDPQAWSIVGGKLYLNYSPRIQASWNQDQAGYIVKADRSWPTVALQEQVVR